MGIKAVSSLQYKVDDLEEALVKVHLSSEEDTSSPEDALVAEKETTLRKRKTGPKAEDDIETLDDVKDLTFEDSFSQSYSTPDSSFAKHNDTPEKYKDPLRWFGVLVPQSLRNSQEKFQKAAELSCLMASLKMKHLQLTEFFGILKRKKRMLLAAKK